jgi:hypothetical protein
VQALGLKPKSVPESKPQLDHIEMQQLLQRTGSGADGEEGTDRMKGVGFSGCAASMRAKREGNGLAPRIALS